MSSNRLSLFDSPLLLGFEHLEKTFDRMKKAAHEGYPPYNIEQISDNGLRITLAVAGFSMSELDVELDGNQLVIRGKQADDAARVYLHRGIAARQFQRAFLLAEGMEVRGATLDSGLLHIDLERITPQPNTRKIQIAQSGKSAEPSDFIVKDRHNPENRN